jgi:hypothetical protein
MIIQAFISLKSPTKGEKISQGIGHRQLRAHNDMPRSSSCHPSGLIALRLPNCPILDLLSFFPFSLGK